MAAISSRSRTSAGLCNEQCICLQFRDTLWCVHICTYCLGCPTQGWILDPPPRYNVMCISVYLSIIVPKISDMFLQDWLNPSHHPVEGQGLCRQEAPKLCWVSNQMTFECFIALVSWSNLRGINPSRLLHQGEVKALTTEHSESIINVTF